jgi:hypothetical protein
MLDKGARIFVRNILLIVVGGGSAFGAFAAATAPVKQPEKSTFVADAPGGGLQIVGNFLYIAAWGHGFHVLDISNPTHPKWIGGWNNHTSPTGVYVAGDHAYLANRTSGFDVIDVRNPQCPAQVGHLFTGGDAWSVYVAGNLAYVADWRKGLDVINVSDIKKPELVGNGDTKGQAASVQVSDGFAYVSFGGESFRIYDLTDASKPKQMNASGSHLGWLGIQVVGNNLYFAGGNELQVIDVTDRSVPVVRGSCRLDGLSDRAVHVSGHNAYVPFSCGGLQIIDVSDPDKPHSVGIFKTSYCEWDVRVVGNYAYLMDRGANLHVIDISDPTNPKEVGGLGTCNFCSKVLSLTNSIVGASVAKTQYGTGGAITDAPPQLVDAARTSDNAFNFTLRGVPEGVYFIQASTDLISWTNISTNTLPAGGTLRIWDPDTHLFNNRFYRAVKEQ